MRGRGFDQGNIIPSEQEIRDSYREALECYNPKVGKNSRLILIPCDDDNNEARVCAATALYHLPNRTEDREAILIGHNDQDRRLDSQLQVIDEDHGYMLTPLSWVTKYALLDPKASVQEVTNYLIKWMTEDNRRVLIFASNLSGRKHNQETVNRDEDGIITALLQGGEIPMTLELQVLASLVSGLGLAGTGLVTCYTDSDGKRRGWETGNIDKEVTSYVSIIWGVNNQELQPFDVQFLVAYARTCLVSKVLGTPPPAMPSWSPFWKKPNGAFVGIPSRASVGRYQAQGKSIVDNVKEAALDLPRDARERWKNPLTKPEVWRYEVKLNILQRREEWITTTPDIALTPQDNRGILLILPNGISATYLPEVWLSIPNKSFEYLMSMLSIKASGDPDDWKLEGTRILLYTTMIAKLC